MVFPPGGANENSIFALPHTLEPMVTNKGYVTQPWFMFFQNMNWAVPQVGAAPIPDSGGATGDVIQTGTVTAGHVAVWTSDHHIGDGGSTFAVPMHYATLTVNNTNFKALPTTFLQIVAAPGANKLLLPFFAVLALTVPSGAYTGVDAGSQQGLTIAYGDWNVDAFAFYRFNGAGFVQILAAMHLIPDAAQLIAAYADQMGSTGGLGGAVNLPFKIVAWNSGNYTGGGASNSLLAGVIYGIVDTTTGALS